MLCVGNFVERERHCSEGSRNIDGPAVFPGAQGAAVKSGKDLFLTDRL